MGPNEPIKQQLLGACLTLVQKGLLMATGGNLSLRVPEKDAFAITPSNFDYLKMTPADVCILDFDLHPLEGDHRPSVESAMHAGIYQTRSDVNVVIHTHQVYASALALIGEPIPPLFDEQIRFLGRTVDVIPYATSGTEVLGQTIAAHIQNGHHAYILKNHGALCFGHDAERAVHNAEILEKCSLAYLLALCTGKEVSQIPLPVRETLLTKMKRDQDKYLET
jgi:L-ribulose-5-phosphate 4-epimerase